MSKTVKHPRLCIYASTYDATWVWRRKNESRETGVLVGKADPDWFTRKEEARKIINDKFGHTNTIIPYSCRWRNRDHYHPDLNVWWFPDKKFRTDIPVFLEDDEFYDRVKQAGEYMTNILNQEISQDARLKGRRTFFGLNGKVETFAYYAEVWLKSAVGIKPNTRKAYDSYLDAIKRNMGGMFEEEVAKLNNLYWIQLFTNLKNENGKRYSHSYVKNIKAHINTILSYARDDGAIFGDPLKNVTKRVKMQGASKETVKQEAYPLQTTWDILKFVHDFAWPSARGENYAYIKPPRKVNKDIWRKRFILCLLLWDTGANVADVLSWKVKDVDFKKRLIHGKRLKTGSEFTAGMQISTAKIIQHLTKKKGSNTPLVNLTRGQVTGFFGIMKKQLLGKDAAKYAPSRSWRYALRTELLRAGVSREVSSRIMGHQVALNHGDSQDHDTYLRIADEDVMDAYEKLELHRINKGVHLSEDPIDSLKRYHVAFRKLNGNQEKIVKFGT